MLINIDFSQLQDVIKRIKNPALQKKLNALLLSIQEQVDPCNQHYALHENSTAPQVTDALTKIQKHLDALSKLAEFGDSAASLIPTPSEKQAIHLIQQTLQRSLPKQHSYLFDGLVAIRDKSRIALSPVRELRFQAARRIFKQFLLQELQPFIRSLGEPKKIFMSYAWATLGHASYHRDKVYEGQVEKIADDLERVGCKVFLDRWYDQAGNILLDFLELMDQSDFFIPVGTHLYLKKYNKQAELENEREHVVRTEGQILSYIASYSHGWQKKIIPILLEGTSEETLPLLLRPQLPLELHKEDYFDKFFALVKKIYGIDNRDKTFKQLESQFYQWIKPLTQQDVTSLQATIQTYQEPKAQRPSQKHTLWASNLSLSHKLWHVPAPNLHFTGRTELIQTLYEKLTKSQNQMVAITALHGLGGIGKTQLAIKYVYDHHQTYKNIFWISAESEEQLLADYRALAEKLNIPIEGKTSQEVATQLKDWFEHKQHTGWLIVYDNVNDPKLVETYKPKHGGAVLVTSRRTDWAGIPPLGLSVFSLMEARDYIQKITGYSIETYKDDMNKLAKQLGYLPLALAQACAYIAKKHTRLQDYLNLYTENRLAMLADKTMPLDAAHEPVAVTWQITFKAIQEQHPASLPLLESCAYLHADNIPEFLLKALFNQQQPEQANQLKPFIEAVGCLQQYSLLKLIAPSGEKAFSMHRLVQEVIFDSLAPEHQQNYLKQVSTVLKAIYPYDLVEHLEDYWLQNQLLPHLEGVLKLLDVYQSKRYSKDLEIIKQQDLERADLLTLLAHGYGKPHLGNNVRKKKMLLERALDIFKQHYGSEHHEVAKILVHLGNAHGNLGDAKTKEVMLKQALAIEEKHYGTEHWEVAITLRNLGVAYGSLGETQKKKELLEKALVILEKHYGPKHVELAITLVHLGNAHGNLGDHQKQKTLLEQALAIEEKHYGPQHSEVAITLRNLGVAYGSLGKTRKKKVLLEKALVILEKHYGPEHVEVAITLVHLGKAHGNLGDAKTKEVMLKRALAIEEKHYGPQHSEVAITLRNLGLAYGSLGETQKKKVLLEKALGILEKHYGPKHVEVAITLVHLGKAHGNLGDAKTKEVMLKRALAIEEQHYGPEHSEVAITLGYLVSAYLELQQFNEAKIIAERSYQIFLTHPDAGPQHSRTKTAKKRLDKINQKLSEPPIKLTSGNTVASDKESLAALEKQLGNVANVELLTQFLKENKALNINAQDNGQHQRSALHWAVVKEAIPCIKVLLQAGADIFLQDKAGKSALDYACELPDPIVLSLLLCHQYQLPLEDEIDIGKLLRRAAHEGNADVIQKILEKWPDKINEKDQGKTERTALHWAVIEGHTECVKVLLATGADPSICDKENYSAIARAKKLNHVAINKLFEDINVASSSSSVNVSLQPNFPETIYIESKTVELQQAIARSLLDINSAISHTSASSPSAPTAFFQASTSLTTENELQKQIQANYAELYTRAQLVNQTEEERVFDNKKPISDQSFYDNEDLSEASPRPSIL